MSLCLNCGANEKCFASALSKKELNDLVNHKTEKSIKRGEVIFEEDQVGRKIIMIISGSVKLQRDNYLARPVIMRIAHDCEMIGLEAMLKNNHYLMTAVALTEVVYWTISKEDMEAILESNKAARTKVREIMFSELAYIYKHSLFIISGTSESKIAHALISLSGRDGEVLITKEEIAAMTGMTRETASRVLSRMNKEKIIKGRQREITILNKRELEKLKSGGKKIVD